MIGNGVAITILAVALLASIGLSAVPRSPDRDVAVVFPPWTSGAEAVARATASGATLVRPGRYPFVVIVHPGGGVAGPAARTGAWFILDASKVRGCSAKGGLRA